jgi:tyrosine-protein phosphatase SIW14
LDISSFLVQFAFLYAPLVHSPTQEVTPFLYRGMDPKKRQIYALHNQGIKTIISLRTNPEKKKQRLCQKLGMTWVQIPTGVFKTPTDDQFDQFRALISDKNNQPCYICCELDMDRTGVYLAAYRMVDQKWSAAQMDAEFREHHQKRWWPIFRKYQRVVANYAQKRLVPLTENESAVSASSQEPLH